MAMAITATIDATHAEGGTMPNDRMTLEEGVVVHDYLLHQDARGSWWGTNDGTILYATELDGLLVKVAEATGTSTDLDDLRGRFDRACAREERRRAEDAIREAIDGGNKPPNSARCPRCGGLGTVTKGAGRVTCPTCGGTGTISTK